MEFDRVGKFEFPVEPADPGPIHAWLYSANPGPPIDSFRDAPKDLTRLRRWILSQRETALLEDGDFVRAACGRRVRVIYLYPFNTVKVDACPECASMAKLWQTDPDEYDRQVAERNERWAANDRRRLEEQDDAASEEYDDDGEDNPIEQEDDLP